MEEFLNQIKEDFKDVSNEFETILIKVDVKNWLSSHEALRDKYDLKFFSWLSAIDWDNDVAVGDAPKEQVTPSFEIVSCLSSVDNSNLVTISTTISKDESSIPSLTSIYVGANWHEREAFEMLGVYFDGHPDNRRLLLPEDWADLPPLRKDFAIKGR